MSAEAPVDCAVCGLSLGSGIPGGSKYCGRCADYVRTKARAGSSDSLGGLIILGAAFFAGVLVVNFLQRVFGGSED